VLAQWRYGAGRVVAWTPGLSDAAWAGDWPGQASLWNDAVRWLLPGVPVPALTPALLDAHHGGAPAVIIDPVANAGVKAAATAPHATVIPPSGPAAQVTLSARPGGPGYAGTLPDAGPGVYRLAVTGAGAGPPGALTELAVGYPREYLPSPTGTAMLAQVAAISGGRVLAGPASAGAWERARNGTRRLALWWPLVLLALAAFTAAILAGRPPRGRRPRAPGTEAPDRELAASPSLPAR
jgi:hypothetical protein